MRLLKKLDLTVFFLAVAIIVGVVGIVLATTGDEVVVGPNRPPGFWYHSDREQIGAAIPEFMTRPTDPAYNHTLGEVPIVNRSAIAVNGSEVVQGEEYYVVAVCPLLTSSRPRGILKWLPDTAHPRNCLPEGANAQPNVTDCLNKCNGSYVWLTTINGDVASICIGENCANHNMDGFQDVYP